MTESEAVREPTPRAGHDPVRIVRLACGHRTATLTSSNAYPGTWRYCGQCREARKVVPDD